MTRELFRTVMDLSEKKRKNEEVISRELLETKYKKSYETLCCRLKDAQYRLKVDYLESIREISELASDTAYLDFSQQEEIDRLLDKCCEVYAKRHNIFMKNLLIALQRTIMDCVEDGGQPCAGSGRSGDCEDDSRESG